MMEHELHEGFKWLALPSSCENLTAFFIFILDLSALLGFGARVSGVGWSHHDGRRRTTSRGSAVAGKRI